MHASIRSITLGTWLLLALCPAAARAEAQVVMPAADSIVAARRTTVAVSVVDELGEPASGSVELRVNGVGAGRASLSNGRASRSVRLRSGANVIEGSVRRRQPGGGTVSEPLPPMRVFSRSDLRPAGRQEVVFEVDPAAEERLREIATGTLTRPLSPAELERFVDDVLEHIRMLFDQLYAPFDVVRVRQPGGQNGGAVRVLFEDEDSDLPNVFGTTIPAPATDLASLREAVPDFNNERKTQEVRVFVGTFKRAMVDSGGLLSSTPARADDSLELRIRDVGNAIARTTVHEVGHTLGLVSQPDLVDELAAQIGLPAGLARLLAGVLGVRTPLPDLEGCLQAHNCPAVDDADPLADRFGNGFNVMDPGELTPLFARIGVTSATDRTPRPTRFNNFNASYLSIVHPAP